MKKFVVLMLVIGMASLASATLQISVDGQQGIDEITIAPSDELILDIYTDSDIVSSDGTLTWVISAAGPGTLGGGVAVFQLADTAVNYSGQFPLGGYFGNVTVFEPGVKILEATTLYDQFLFHCDGPEDVIVSIQLYEGITPIATADQLVIHQIPEPMTMALLGLGGLFLRRRK